MNQLQQLQFIDKYARWNHEEGRRETWEEAVTRASDFLRELSQNKLDESDYETIHNAMLNMEAFCSMRLFAMAGEAGRRNNLSLYNCAALGIDSIDAFCEVMLLSMNGCGVGFSVENRFISRLPVIAPKFARTAKSTYVVADDTEGWVDAFRTGLHYWFDGDDIEFDYSLIRPAGAVLMTKGGRASGFLSLKELLDYSRKVIRENKGKQLTPIQVHDIVTKIADCVVSGGVRRSATLSLFDETDTEMLHAKDNGWWKISPQRSNANNSVVINRKLTRDEISKYMHIMHNGGSAEPGLMFRLNVNRMNPTRRKDRDDWLYNPCFSPDTLIQTKKGVYRIKDLVGESVEVWNGKQWVVVDNFRVTNKDQPGVELELESGDTIVVTSYHSVILSDGSRKLAQDVEVGDELMPSRLATNSYEQTNFKTKVKKTSYRFLDGDVYCCTEPNRHEISLACGVQIGQCAEINLRPMQTCNLTQSIVRSNDTFKSLAQKVRIATIIGTIQSMATRFPGMRDKWRENCEEERLLGVSLDAQADNPSLLTEETMRRLRKIATDTNRDYAEKLGINQSAAITCVKPGGNSSLLFDCSSGLHSRWSKYYIRRMRINANSPIRKMLEQSGFKLHPENGQDYDTANTMVVEFPVKSPDGAITNDDRTALDQLEWWRRNKVFWTNHNPSATITYTSDELEQIIDWLYENQSIIGGLSFLPKDEHDYPLAPMESITKRQYDKMVKKLPEIDFDLLQQIEFEDRTTSASELACFGGTCLI